MRSGAGRGGVGGWGWDWTLGVKEPSGDGSPGQGQGRPAVGSARTWVRCVESRPALSACACAPVRARSGPCRPRRATACLPVGRSVGDRCQAVRAPGPLGICRG